ncbi:hypothetical protein [Klebsiella aerogenes]|jgi:hypothetical protein|uniref:hypothetical protein n=1 Tax=Klebsiella aerogenes TaxID=548 RepID=UPI00063CDD8F|nr:hypothetical protein [Klebsiella aerogenes]DAT30170.1 MAG TPA: hypothetical protein [Caudoviricetes sp.]AMQ58171.1 hypothetical protein AL497_24445 [Klebsiella aerogenes]AVF02238.1 hypothetical protein AM441_27030 [Klebsiella aerogenes]EKU4983871.1 hypothetical protein [Klebsiella aerogenes]EME1359509.1 hypothetical protein [Klebsiella aerogenes]
MIRIDELSGGAKDTLFALFFRGALPSGDLPAKSGAAELRERGLAESGNTAMAYQGENYFTWLTPAGLKFCVEHFVTPRSCAMDISYMFKTPPDDTVTSYEGQLCGNSIEQETLSAVLVHFLPTTNLDKASDHAVKLASAVKASFAELDRPTGGVVSGEYAPLRIFGEIGDPITIPVSTIKPGADGEGKQVSTLTVRVEMDASSVLQSLDEVESAISKHIATVLDKGLKPGGKIWSAIKNHR